MALWIGWRFSKAPNRRVEGRGPPVGGLSPRLLGAPWAIADALVQSIPIASRPVLDCPVPPPAAAAAAASRLPLDFFHASGAAADDSMAIMAAFNSPEIEVLGLTSMYGNVPTAMATRNALTLCQLAGRPEVPASIGRERGVRCILASLHAWVAGVGVLWTHAIADAVCLIH